MYYVDTSCGSIRRCWLKCVCLFLLAGAAAVDYVIDHAEIDFVFIQDKKVEGVR